MSWIRKVTRHCGRYGKSSSFIQVSYFPHDSNKKIVGRQRRHEVTPPRQKALNNKRAKRYLEALIYSNFGKGDLRIDLTYSPQNMPSDEKAAKKEIQNYIKRINYRRKKQGLGNARYIVVTEIGAKGKIHHHLIMDADMDRNIVEDAWGKGYANTRRLQPDAKTKLTELIKYLVKDFKTEGKAAGKRKWDSSLNLVKPWETINDDPRQMSKKKINLMKKIPEDCEQMKQLIEKDNPGYELMWVERTINKETATWSFFCRMKLIGSDDDKDLSTNLSTELSTKENKPVEKAEGGNGNNRRNKNCKGKTKASGAKKPKPQGKVTKPL